MSMVIDIRGRQILDSRGNPTVEADVRLDDGSFHYAMGFDDQRLPGDSFVNIDDVSMVVSATSKALVEGMTIDFVELEPGKQEFIFLNPNDPDFVPPQR